LIIAKEMLAATLLSIHNLRGLIRLTHEMRQSILDGEFDQFVESFVIPSNLLIS
jgi:queuine tRNA-ribosyltransferase